MTASGEDRRKVCRITLGALLWTSFVLVVFVELSLNFLGIVDHIVTMQEEAEIGGRSLQEEASKSRVGRIGGLGGGGMSLFIRVAVFLGVCILQCTVLYCHWNRYIKPDPNKFIPRRAVVPDDLKGNWKYGMFDCMGELGTCCCFSWFPACMFSDLWYRAGWIHAFCDKDQHSNDSLDGSCPGYLFFAGCCGWCLANDCLACCTCCGYATLRGGIECVDGGDGGLGKIVPMRKRFGVPHDGFKTFIMDTLAYCFCAPCAATQEYRQVMELLDRGPVQEVINNVPIAVPVMGAPAIMGEPVAMKQEL